MIWMSLFRHQCTEILMLKMSADIWTTVFNQLSVSFVNEEKKSTNNNNNALRWNNWEMIAINSKVFEWIPFESRMFLKCSWRSLSRFVWLRFLFCTAALFLCTHCKFTWTIIWFATFRIHFISFSCVLFEKKDVVLDWLCVHLQSLLLFNTFKSFLISSCALCENDEESARNAHRYCKMFKLVLSLICIAWTPFLLLPYCYRHRSKCKWLLS